MELGSPVREGSSWVVTTRAGGVPLDPSEWLNGIRTSCGLSLGFDMSTRFLRVLVLG